MPSVLKAWIEAIRLRTLPVSVAGVLCAYAYAINADCIRWLPGFLCLAFAVVAQISSNFANEYYDFKAGLDKVGRTGPRRGVTEGDISPNAMKWATFITLFAACAVGCSLIYWGGWWLIIAGIAIAVGVLAYSTGPYPLSHHGLGEIAVLLFFGLIPVNLTYYIMGGGFSAEVAMGSVAIGLMGANVLIVNNYRDVEDDKAVGKNTLAVKLGRVPVRNLYLINGLVATALMGYSWYGYGIGWLSVPALYLLFHVRLYIALRNNKGISLNKRLGQTAMLMLAYVVAFAVAAMTSHNFNSL